MSIITEPVHLSAPSVTTRYGFPVREDVALTDANGTAKPRLEKDFEKTVTPIAAALARVLEPGETVFFATRATPPLSAIEQVTMSWVLYGYYRVALVFTDRRMLVFSTTSRGVWRGTVKQLRWSEVTKVKPAGFVSPCLKLKLGSKSIVYTRMARRAVKKLKAVVPLLMSDAAAKAPSIMPVGLQSLCPRCCGALQEGVYTCASCGMEFKSIKTLALKTLIPGGAYFYFGLTGPGILSALVESIFLLDIVMVAALPDQAGDRTVTAAMLLAIVVFEKAVTFLHARRFALDFEPVKIDDITLPAARAIGASV